MERSRAHAIGTHLNKWSGATFISHDTLAKRLGVDAKTIARAIAELERRGHLSVTRSKGRGNANVLSANFRMTLASDRTIRSQKTRQCRPKNPTTLSKKPDKAVAPTLLSYPIQLPIRRKRRLCRRPRANGRHKSITSRRSSGRRGCKEQAEQNNIEATLADRLTIGGAIDGREVLLNADPQQLAILSVKCRQNELTPDDIAQAQGAYRALLGTRKALEFMPERN